MALYEQPFMKQDEPHHGWDTFYYDDTSIRKAVRSVSLNLTIDGRTYAECVLISGDEAKDKKVIEELFLNQARLAFKEIKNI